MKKSLRWVAVAATAATATATLAGCGFGGGDQGGSDDASANTINLLVASYSDGTKANWEKVIDGFEAANDDITVKLDVESWDDIDSVIKTRIQAGKQPDILNENAFASYVSDDLLYKASDVVSDKTLGDFLPAFVDRSKVGDTQYALPFIASARALFYNKDMFEKVGISDPPTTWAEFETDAAKLKKAGFTAYGMPLGKEEAQAETALWFYGGGGGYGDEQTLTIDDKANVAAATEMQKIIENGWTQDNPGASDRTPLLNVFIQGKLGMQAGLPPTVAQIKDKNPDLNYGVSVIPTKDGDPTTLGVVDYLMAFKNKDVDKRPAIKKFLDYFYSPDVYNQWLTAETFLPTTTSGGEAAASDPAMKPFIEGLPRAVFYPSTNPNWPAAQDAIKSQIGRLGQGEDPAKLLTSIQAKATAE